jgi:uncharacterized protein with FMN-binding domain
MSSNTKIVVLRMKELIYTLIFVGLGILLIILFVSMFRKDKNDAPASAQNLSYIAGVYSSSLTVNSQNIDVEVTVDTNYIKGIRFVNMDESITTMYPLMQPALEELAAQIIEKQSLEEISISDDSRYTSSALKNAIAAALEKAKPAE